MNDDDDPPIESTKKKGFLGTLQKRGTLSKRKQSKNSHPTEGAVNPVFPADPSTSVRDPLEGRGAKRKFTKTELKDELKSVYAQLDQSRLANQQKDKTIDVLTKKNKTLKDKVDSASHAVRSAKSTARDAQAVARATSKDAERSVNAMAQSLERKEDELLSVRQGMETAIRAEIDLAVEKSEVSCLRANCLEGPFC
jgi:ribosomal protein L15